MRKFNPGDQVGFVNEKGGGTVVALTKTGQYRIAIEDGFEITMAGNELVLEKPAADLKTPPVVAPVDMARVQPENKPFFRVPENELSLVILPAMENKVLTGDIEFFVVNQTPFELYFVLTCDMQKEHHLVATGRLGKGEEMKAGTFARQALTDWEKLHMQCLFFRLTPYAYLPPLKRDLPLLLPDLSVSGNEKGRLAFARYIPVYRYSGLNETDWNGMAEKLENLKSKGLKSAEIQRRRETGLSEQDERRFGILRNSKEVDLHMEHLAGKGTIPDDAYLLEVQIRHFNMEMDKAILNHYHSIVFIHGVGEGVLRNALIHELKNYAGISWRNGAYEKYGAGAIEVLFH